MTRSHITRRFATRGLTCHHLAARWLKSVATALVFVMAITPHHGAAAATLERVTTPRGVTQAFLLHKPEKPDAAVILFAGGHGALGLVDAGKMRWGAGNFLVRSRDKFAEHNLLVAVIDAPADQQDGMSAVFRMSSAHAGDIGAVAAHLRKLANVPVWLVGTSMGTFSAAGGAIGAKGIDGLVLTSTITRAKPEWAIKDSHRDGVGSMPLDKISVPTLIVAHRNDGCPITPASDAGKLSKRLTAARKVETVVLEGGDPPQSAPCEAKSQHGFLGIEGKAVDAIAGFVKAQRK